MALSEVKSPSHVWLFATLWTVASQAPPSMGFSRQEYWSGLPFPSPGDLPNPRIEPGSPALQADSLPTELWRKPSAYNSVTLLLTQDEIYRLQVFHHRLEYLFPMWHSFLCSVAQSCQTLCDPWTIPCQAPLSMRFPRQEYSSGLPFPSPGDRPDPEIEPDLLHCKRILYWLSRQDSPGWIEGRPNPI